MRLSGFTFVRNATIYDYPVLESIRSALDICDEFVVNVGDSEDDTIERVRSIASPKLRIVESRWDPQLRKSGEILARQTDIALDHCRGDWALYLQADEVLHEEDLPEIQAALTELSADRAIEGFLFEYLHFYGSYWTLARGRKWYRREVRLFRRDGVRSYRDAQGFRRHGRKLRVAFIPVRVFHYGWVRPPKIMGRKKADFDRLWHPDRIVQEMNPAPERFEYSPKILLARFSRTHPGVMAERIRNADWEFNPPEEAFRINGSLFEKLLWALEVRTGIRLGEYRNYKLIRSFPEGLRGRPGPARSR